MIGSVGYKQVVLRELHRPKWNAVDVIYIPIDEAINIAWFFRRGTITIYGPTFGATSSVPSFSAPSSAAFPSFPDMLTYRKSPNRLPNFRLISA